MEELLFKGNGATNPLRSSLIAGSGARIVDGWEKVYLSGVFPAAKGSEESDWVGEMGFE